MSNGAVIAIVLTVVVHFAGMIVLFLAMGDDFRSIFRTGGGGGGWSDGPPPDEPVDPTGGGGDLLPLPDADQAAVRLREPGRLSERYARPARRPDHTPEPGRTNPVS